MKNTISLLFIAFFIITGCRQTSTEPGAKHHNATNVIKHATGLEIYRYKGYSVVKVTRPWPDAIESYTYVLQQKNAAVPDSLKKYTAINVPVKSIISTSTTHIPSLEMLGVENTLAGFPGTQWISSEKTRALIDSGKVKEAGANESLNTEVVLNLQPDVLVAFCINSSNKTLTALQQSGIKLLYNGDWTEQTPLGRAEWIKLFGELYGLQNKADAAFTNIEKDYLEAQKLAQNISKKPTVMAGAMLNDQWITRGGGSYEARFLKDAGANYLWADTDDTGSLSLSFEVVLEKAQDADFWIGPSQFTSLEEMLAANPHYAQFKAFKNQQVYSFSTKKGKTGGLVYFELAPNRPDLVLKDLVKILHPELLPDYRLQFFEKLK
jgi:iron complex transport system substrate-binding protein